jgi:RNA polymerase sigma factor (sigma-70 family)
MSVMEGGLPASLVAQAATGDEVAFARIVAAYHDDMARVCFVVCRDTALAQEAVQSAWPIAWRKLSTIRAQDRLRPWLVAIAANEARQLLRQRRRRALREIPIGLDGSGPGLAAVEDPADRVAAVDLANALARLGVDDRVIIAMSAAGLSSGEIGRELGMTASGVRSRLGRLLGRLREELRDG